MEVECSDQKSRMEAYELWVVWRLCIEAIAIDGWLLPALMEMEPMEVVVGQD